MPKNHFIVKTRPDCQWCVKAKELLVSLNEDFTEQFYSTDVEIANFKREGWKTFPQIFLNGQHIGGYSELVSWMLAETHK